MYITLIRSHDWDEEVNDMILLILPLLLTFNGVGFALWICIPWVLFTVLLELCFCIIVGSIVNPILCILAAYMMVSLSWMRVLKLIKKRWFE